jgi:hypothetical protein
MVFLRTKGNVLPSVQLVEHDLSCYEFDLSLFEFLKQVYKMDLNFDDLFFERIEVKPKYKQIIVSDCIMYRNLDYKTGIQLISKLFNYKMTKSNKFIEEFPLKII